MSRAISRQAKGWLYNMSAQAFWGTGSTIIHFISAALPTTMLVGIRHGLGALLLGGRIITSRQWNIFQNLPWKHMILLGLLGGATPDWLLVISVRDANPVLAILLARLEIPVGVLLAHFLLKEKVTKRAYFASIIGLLGTACISYKPGEAFTLHGGFYLGIAAGISAGFAWGMASVYAKYILNRKVDAMAVTFTRLGLGSITSFILMVFVVKNPIAALQSLNIHDWFWLAFIGVFNSGVAYLLFYRSLEIIDAHIAQILLGVSMIVAVILGLIIGIPISALQWLGILTIIYSIYLIKLPKTTTEAVEV